MTKIIIPFLLVLSTNLFAQNFEGTITWSFKTDIQDPAMKAQMEESQKRMNDPEMQKEMKEMKERMNDPQMKAMMESNPQLKAQMDNMMKMSQGGGMNSMMPTGFTIKTKNGNSITKMEGGMMAGNETLYLKDKDQTYLLNTSAKTYSTVSQGNLGNAKMPADVKVTKTTEKQKILNYNCTKTIVTVTDHGKTMNQIFWTTTEIKDFDFKSLSKQRMGQGGQTMFYENIEGVPLKMEMTSPEMKMIMEVTAIKREPIANSAFEIPAGFTETKLPGQH